MREEIIGFSATQLVKKIKNKDISVLEVVTSFLDHIERHNPTINAISDCYSREQLLMEAREKDHQLLTQKTTGPLHGIPVTIKESFLTKGLKISNGDPLLRNYIATEDAELVKRLREAGAIIIGVTNVALYCIDWQSTNFWNGQTNNPHDLKRVAGGSSGGSSAAVAANFSPLSLGAGRGRFC